MVKASRAARPRRRRASHCGVKWTFLPKDHPGPIYLCVNADESEPCTFNNRILMEEDPHQVLEGIMLACYAIKATTAYFYIRYEYGDAYRAPAAGDRRVLRRRAARQEHPRQRLQPRHLPAPRGRGVHLRRGDRADREPRRQAGLAADQAAVPRRRRGVPQADRRQQRRDAGLRHAHPRPRRRLVQVDRRAARPEEPARRRQLRAEALLPRRPRQQARLRRAAAGRHRPRADRQARRRRLEGPQGQGRDPRRHQHGLHDRGRVRHCRSTSTAPARSAASAWARRRSS